MSSLHTAPFLNSCLSAFPPPSVSPWRWGPSTVSWVSCEHRREGRDAFHRQRRSRAGEPWQQGETQTQQPTTPNRKSHSTYPSDTRMTALSLLPKCHFPPPPPLPELLGENGWENWAGWRWRSTLLQTFGIMFSSPSDLFWSEQATRLALLFVSVHLSFRYALAK